MNNRQRKKNQMRQIERKIQSYLESLKELPSWYWKHGIHDAKILDIEELENGIDRNRGKYYKNCAVLSLDCSNSIYERNIERIIFYNYEVRKADVSISNLSQTWWLCDSIERLSNGNYLLDFEVDPENGDKWFFSIEFETIDVNRK